MEKKTLTGNRLRSLERKRGQLEKAQRKRWEMNRLKILRCKVTRVLVVTMI